jgi:plastocyanin
MRRMRLITIAALIAAMFAPTAPAHAAAKKKPPTVRLSMSNFRFCPEMECTPFDVGYLRPTGTPIPGSDNPLEIVEVKRGTLVSWVYRDAQCDGADGCGGHNVYFENGGAGQRKGFAPARKGARTINVRITQKPGTTIRYFCTVNGHDQIGMTGILEVT